MDIVISGIVSLIVSAIGTLLTLYFRGAFLTERRLSVLEQQIQPFKTDWHTKLENRLATLEARRNFMSELIDELRRSDPKGNPIDPQRYQYLLDQMQANALTQPEARELNAALIELQQQARQGNDLAKLLAIGLGLLILAALLKD